MTTATAELCGHPLPAGRRCVRDRGHRGLHQGPPSESAELCGHRWPAERCYRRHAAPVTGNPPHHRCTEPANHPTTVPHRCRCGATTTRGDAQRDDQPA